jgi:hypothetical protein
MRRWRLSPTGNGRLGGVARGVNPKEIRQNVLYYPVPPREEPDRRRLVLTSLDFRWREKPGDAAGWSSLMPISTVWRKNSGSRSYGTGCGSDHG